MTTTTHPVSRSGSAVVTLPTDTTIGIERSFDAPAALVWKAWTTPELVRRFWTERPMDVCDIDLRVGGSWRYVFTEPGVGEVGFHGVYSVVDAPTHLVSTEVYEAMGGDGAVNDLTLTERDGVTTMYVLVTHSCQEHRDGHIGSGMEGGMQRCMDRIDEIVAELQAAGASGAAGGEG